MTAQDLIDLATALNSFAAAIDTKIDSLPNPYDPQFLTWRTMEGQIAGQANQLSALAIAQLAPEISAATQQLTGVIATAQNQLQTIQNIQQVASIISTVLATAVAAATGNPFSAAGSVTQLVSQIQKLLSPAPAAPAAGN